MSTRRSISIILAISIFLLLLVPCPAAYADSDPEWPHPGAIDLGKTATAISGDEYSFKVTLSIDGKDKNTKSGGTPASVVLVIDQSSSMSSESRMVNAKKAAKEILDILQPTSASITSVAVVAFSDDVTMVTDFCNFSQKDSLKSKIDGLNPISLTGIQPALKKARDMLAARTGEKYIVLLSDGMPNMSYAATSQKTYNDLKPVSGSKYNFNYLYTGFNYSSALDYNFDQGVIKSISEAEFAREAGIKIYSVALGNPVVPDLKYCLYNIADSPDHYMEATSSELVGVFAKIAEKIVYSAEDGVVVDELATIPGYPADIAFEYDTTLGQAAVSQGTVSYNATTKSFTWNVGTITESETATLTYYVTTSAKLRSLINSGNINPETTLFYISKSAVFSYTNVNGDAASKAFPNPMVVLPNTRGLMYARFVEVDSEGYLLDADGVRLIEEEQDKPWLAKELAGEKQIKNTFDRELMGGWVFIVGNNYDIELPANNGVVGYKPYGDPVVNVLVEDSQTYVYFTFVKVARGEQDINITFVIDEGDGGTFEPQRSRNAVSNEKVVVQTYVYGETIVPPVVITEAGYTFENWSPDLPRTATQDGEYSAIIVKAGTTTTDTDAPRTGDETNIVTGVLGILISMGILSVVILKKRNKKTSEISR